LCEPLGGTEGLIKTAGSEKTTEVCGEEQARMLAGSEFHTTKVDKQGYHYG